jgi:hypothetical protein
MSLAKLVVILMMEFRGKWLSHTITPGSLAGEPFGIEVIAVERKLLNSNIIEEKIGLKDMATHCGRWRVQQDETRSSYIYWAVWCFVSQGVIPLVDAFFWITASGFIEEWSPKSLHSFSYNYKRPEK